MKDENRSVVGMQLKYYASAAADYSLGNVAGFLDPDYYEWRMIPGSLMGAVAASFSLGKRLG